MDCYTKKGDRGYDLVPEDDYSDDRSDDSHKKKKKKVRVKYYPSNTCMEITKCYFTNITN